MPVDEMLSEMDALDPQRPFAEWDREFLREVGWLPEFSPLVSIEARRLIRIRQAMIGYAAGLHPSVFGL